jgi:hypothetical protein
MRSSYRMRGRKVVNWTVFAVLLLLLFKSPDFLEFCIVSVLTMGVMVLQRVLGYRAQKEMGDGRNTIS